MTESDQWAKLERELRKEGITDSRVLDAMARVPRELFVPTECRAHALRNIPLPIGHGQTISQPLVVAMMTQALELTGTETILEVGTGSGYQCALLAELGRKVVSIERLEALATAARARLAKLGYSNVEVVIGDGTLGYPELAPYDAIIVTASTPTAPQPLLDQLADGGRIVVPVGSHSCQELILHTKRGGKFTTQRLGAVRFVPLIGEAGWQEREADLLFQEW